LESKLLPVSPVVPMLVPKQPPGLVRLEAGTSLAQWEPVLSATVAPAWPLLLQRLPASKRRSKQRLAACRHLTLVSEAHEHFLRNAKTTLDFANAMMTPDELQLAKAGILRTRHPDQPMAGSSFSLGMSKT
jgi:hypothetical protein